MNMTRLLTSTVALLATILINPAEAVSVEHKSFPSKALGRDYPYSVILPEGYNADTTKSYPVLYLLHGANGDEREWIEKGKADRTIQDLIDKKQIPPMIVVTPGHKAAWWVDGAKEKGETAFIDELMPLIESNYRVTPNRGNRLIAGLSAGGYGAARFVMKYPEKFAAAAALSPAVYSDAPPSTSSARKQPPFTNADGLYDNAKWRALNYTALIERYKQQPLRVPMYINSGDHDRFEILPEAMHLYQRMREIQKDVEFRVVDGDHEWTVWETTLGEALRYLTKWLPTSGTTNALAHASQ